MIVKTSFVKNQSAMYESKKIFIGSFVLMILCAVLASDKCQLDESSSESKKTKNNISFFKIIIFSAAIFSLHIIYKIIVSKLGGIIGAYASVIILDCVGLFINPISVMVYAFTISTLSFSRKFIQAVMIGLLIFFIPAAMTFYSFTPEHIAIYSSAVAISVTGGVFYKYHMKKKSTPFIAYFILDIVYFISKYFMILHSDQVSLITAKDLEGKLKQYLACVEVDLILSLILLFVLFIYKVVTTENVNIKKNIVLLVTFLVLTGTSISFGRTELTYQHNNEHVINLSEEGKTKEAQTDCLEIIEYIRSSNKFLRKRIVSTKVVLIIVIGFVIIIGVADDF